MSHYSNPDVPLITDPVNLDKEIQTIQLAIASIPWMQKSFGRAWTGRRNGILKTFRYPEVYLGRGEYYNCMPNDNLKSQSFIRVRKDKGRSDNYSSYHNNVFVYPIDIITVFNLNEIDPSKNYRFTEELKKDVLKTLNVLPNVKIQNIFEDPIDVFEGYDLDHDEWQTFKHPRGGFKFECELSFTEEC